jgi:DNA processing protein
MAAHSVAFDLMALLDAPGVGPGRVRKLLKRCGPVGEAALGDRSFLRGSLTDAQIDALPASREKMERQWDQLAAKGIHALSVTDDAYPAGLRTILGEEAPVVLLCQGNLALLNAIGVGFCGSREATEKGMATARDTASLLAERSVNVVSGYAAGVDMNAHCAALRAGGTTTVVLAEGILRFRVKSEIRECWDPARVLVVSEFGANLPWSVSHAMTRNRTICGLSRGMVLIEARATGGSIQAGRDCLRLGLPLFAAVYEGMPESAVGNEQLLQSGGRPLMKSRATGMPNVSSILQAVRSPASTAECPPTEGVARLSD